MGLNLNFAKAMDTVEKSVSRHRILVVDDEPGNLRTLERYLSRDYPVVCFEDPVKALEHLTAREPGSDYSLIISDHIMPEMTGVEFLTEVSKIQHSATRVILTGFAALDNVIAAINSAGVFRYVTKPVGSAEMLHVVEEAIRYFEIREENGALVRLVKDLIESSARMSKELTSLGHPEKAAALDTTSDKTTAPRRVGLTVLFADVRGFTKISAKHPPEVIIDIIQRVIEPIHEVVYNHGGIVDKHLGDGLMAVFGFGSTSGEQAGVAACTALCDTIAETIAGLPEPFNSLKISLGLASGEVVVGLVGSANRRELAIIGQPANFASRLQEFSKVALDPTSVGSTFLGPFDKVIALLDSKLASLNKDVEIVELNDEFNIRDFPNERKVGIIRR